MGKAYEVRKISELSQVSKAGGVEKVYRHQIETEGGTVLTVDISAENFTKELAAPILEAAAKNADDILAS